MLINLHPWTEMFYWLIRTSDFKKNVYIISDFSVKSSVPAQIWV